LVKKQSKEFKRGSVKAQTRYSTDYVGIEKRNSDGLAERKE